MYVAEDLLASNDFQADIATPCKVETSEQENK